MASGAATRVAELPFLEGLLTCVLAIAFHFLISDSSENAKWLKNGKRSFIVGRLAADQCESNIESGITW